MPHPKVKGAKVWAVWCVCGEGKIESCEVGKTGVWMDMSWLHGGAHKHSETLWQYGLTTQGNKIYGHKSVHNLRETMLLK